MASSARRLVRYALGERLTHTAAALTYVYLLLTGLAFWSPHLYWIAIVLGGGYFSRMMHPWVGLVFAAVVVWMWIIWRRDMGTTAEDRAWRAAMPHYVRNEDHLVPPAGRFNFGQKQLFWIMVIGGVALFISGLALWFVDAIPWQLRGLRFAATLLHAVAALVTIGGFIVHIYMGLFVVPGGFTAIVNGHVTEDWARAHHPLWYQEVQSAGSASSSTPARRSEATPDAKTGA